MTDYEQGFDEGERKAFDHRHYLRKQQRPERIETERDRGFWDGYTPRSLAWRIRTNEQAKQWHSEAA